MPKDDFFKKKVAALLHDSPSKPWIISRELTWLGEHEKDAKNLATEIFGNEVGDLIAHPDVKQADKLAASFDRWILSFLMGGDYKPGAFATSDVKLFNIFYREKPHEASLNPPPKDRLQYHKLQSNFVTKIKSICQQALGKGDWHLAYNIFYGVYEYLWCRYFGTPGPADTRIPTHTVFDHTYATASTLNMIGNGKIDGYMVSIDLGGVQNFISASRKLRDLWTSSWLTSSLAWSIVLPFIKTFGPDILILPTARGNPFFYHTLACMLKARDIHEDIERAAELAGYKTRLGYPQHAVVPATITFVLPSLTSYPEDAKLTTDSKELELSDAKNIAEFVNDFYFARWRKLVESFLDMKNTKSIHEGLEQKLMMLREVFDDMAIKESPPLPLRVVVVEIRSDPSTKEAYLAYHKAFRKVSQALRAAGSLKVSSSATLNLTEYTKNYKQNPHASDENRFYACSVCGELPAIPKSLDAAKEINSSIEENLITVEVMRTVETGERLCPYCLIKRLSTTKKVFPKILEVLLDKHTYPDLPRFPSVSSVAAINFKKAIADAAIKSPDIISSLREIIKSREDINEQHSSHVAYPPEQKLLEQIKQKFKEDDLKVLGTLAIEDAEDLLLVGKQRAIVRRLVHDVRKVLNIESIALNTYYAIIKGDGDDVGKVVSGDIGYVKAIPSFKNLFEYLSNLTPNEDLRKILRMIGDDNLEKAAKCLSIGLGQEVETEEVQELLAQLKEGLKVKSDEKNDWKKRLPVSPAYHATISRGLMTLSTQISKEISDPKIGGFIVYSGGDDVLAVSPVETALNVTLKVRSLYGGHPIMGFLKQNDVGSKVDNFVPSLGDLGQSFAVTYAHYRYPLSRALEVSVNSLEEGAKEVEWLESLPSYATSSMKDSVIVTYVPRGGSQTQARLPFSAKGDQVGELVKGIIYALRIIDERKISASLVKDLDEWKDKITASYFIDSKETAGKIVEYVIEKNSSKESDAQSKTSIKELLVKGLDLHYNHKIYEESDRDLAGKLLINEIAAALQAELGARRGEES